jgi:transposase
MAVWIAVSWRKTTGRPRVAYVFVGKGAVFTHSDTNISLSASLYGIKPVIPGRSNRKKRIRQDKLAYKGRNLINRGYSRLNDFRPVVTRSDKLARNSFSTVAAVFPFWL